MTSVVPTIRSRLCIEAARIRDAELTRAAVDAVAIVAFCAVVIAWAYIGVSL